MESIKAYRGQTFPFFWMLSDRLRLPYPFFAFLVNLGLAGTAVALLHRYRPAYAHAFAVVAGGLLFSQGILDFMSVYLSESVLLGVFLLNAASLLCMHEQSSSASRYDLPLRWGLVLISSVMMNSLKPWLLIFNIVHFAGDFVVHCLLRPINKSGLMQRALLLVLAIGAAKLCYSPAFTNTPATINMGIFMKLRRADLYVEQRLQNPDLPPQRRAELLSVLPSAQTCPNDFHYACLSQGESAVLNTFRTIYLNDARGWFEILRISWNRFHSNIRFAQSAKKPQYGSLGPIGHKQMPGGTFSSMLFVVFLCCTFLIAVRLVFLRKASEPELQYLVFSVSAVALFLFLAAGSGGTEPERVELPGYIAFYVTIAVLGPTILDFFRRRAFHAGQD
jgi:hypothetical protein